MFYVRSLEGVPFQLAMDFLFTIPIIISSQHDSNSKMYLGLAYTLLPLFVFGCA